MNASPATPEKVRALISRCWDAPFGAGQIAMAEEAIASADALDDDELRFHARMAATNAYQHGGEPAKGFVTFSWCLAHYDEHPDRYRDHDYLLLWHFKYMINSLTRFPEVPLARTYAVLDDMQRRYLLGGHSLQAVHKHRWLVARHVGERVAVEHHYEQWQSAPRDEHSDCVGCDPTDQVWHLVELGRDEEAIALTEPVLSGRLSCAEQPQQILTALLVPYLRTGRLDEARRAHHQAYRAVRAQVADLATVADHIYFLGVSGNETRGLEVVERHLSWLDKAPSPHAEMEFAAAAALVLRRLAASGHGDDPVRGTQESISTLAEELARRATALGARFDARNGTSSQSDRVAATINAEPIVERLPLSLTARLTAAVRRPSSNADRPASSTVADTLLDVPADADLDLLMDLAEEGLRQDLEPRIEALWLRIEAVREQLKDADLTALQRGRLADLHGMRLHGEAVEETERVWNEAVQWYASAGDTTRRQRALGRLGLLHCRHGRLEEGLAEVRASTQYLLEHSSAKDQAGALRRLGVALLHAQLPAESLSVLDRIEEVAEPDPGPRVRLQVMLLRVQALAADGRLEAAADAARTLVEQATLENESQLIGLGEFFLGQGLSMLEDGPGAADAFDRALGHELPDLLEREVRERRAVLLAGSPRAAEVVDDLVALVARLVSEQESGEADHARFHLAVALFNVDRSNDAAEVAEETLYGADRNGNQSLADQARHLLAAIYQRLGEPDQTLSYLDQLAGNLNGFDNAAARARVLEQAGELLFDLDRDAQAAGRLGAAAAAYEVAGLILDQTRALRRQSVAAMFGNEPELARLALERADATSAKIPPGLAEEPEGQYERAWLALDGARALAGIGDPEAALARVAGAPAKFRALESYGEAFLAELTLGEVLLTLGRPTAAEPVLRGVVNGLPRDAAALSRAAYALAHALVQQDRADEARELGAQYGFDLD